ncbi:uncharacterized protein CDAR_255951 [Caerostris darwini]|uniref:Uncharacterized protein n=1 Tax=Caerostris darwini TaxID=1538125 RepID=A0AAV4X003_9ARAC|nr:uncharacterized protein CDAR_255951 [Caerostris darwini]
MSTFQSLLVSKLTIRKAHAFVDTMTEFVETKSTVGIAPVEIQLGRCTENSGIPLYEAAWKKIKNNLMPGRTVFATKTIEKVQTGKFCIFHGYIVLRNRLNDYYREHAFCQLHLSDRHFYPLSLHIPLKKDLPESFLDAFNLGITRMVDADISGRSLKASVEVANLCISHTETQLKSLGLNNIYGVLLMWAGGVLLGGMVLAIEIIINGFKLPPFVIAKNSDENPMVDGLMHHIVNAVASKLNLKSISNIFCSMGSSSKNA